MSMRKAALFALALLPGAALAQEGPGLGEPIAEAAIADLDISIPPDGAGLPEGRGDAARGADVYAAQCASCHGEAGVGGINGMPRLTGGVGSLAGPEPLKTVNSFWPYATGVFDYVRRSMPPTAPRSLSADDLYAVTAYILSIDDLIDDGAVLDAQTLPQVEMPNRDGFVAWWPTPPAG